MALLETKNLHTYFKTRRGIVKAVNGVSYAIEPGKTPVSYTHLTLPTTSRV